MGRSKRIMRWIKKRLFGKKRISGRRNGRNKKKKKSGMKSPPSHEHLPGGSHSLGQTHAIAAATPDSLEPQHRESNISSPDYSELDVSLTELEQKPRAVPELNIITSKFGNIAFEVKLKDEETSPCFSNVLDHGPLRSESISEISSVDIPSVETVEDQEQGDGNETPLKWIIEYNRIYRAPSSESLDDIGIKRSASSMCIPRDIASAKKKRWVRHESSKPLQRFHSHHLVIAELLKRHEEKVKRAEDLEKKQQQMETITESLEEKEEKDSAMSDQVTEEDATNTTNGDQDAKPTNQDDDNMVVVTASEYSSTVSGIATSPIETIAESEESKEIEQVGERGDEVGKSLATTDTPAPTTLTGGDSNKPAGDCSVEEDSLVDRPKLRRISFHSKVQVLNFAEQTQDNFSSGTSTEVVHVDIQNESDSEVEMKRVKFSALRKSISSKVRPKSRSQRSRHIQSAQHRSTGRARCDLESDSDSESEDEQTEGETKDCDESDSESEWEKIFKPLKLPKELVFEPLPKRFATTVDTRVKPDVPADSLDKYEPNAHPITRRRYFVYCNDRMKDESYNLHLDGVVEKAEGRQAKDVIALGEILEEPTRQYTSKMCSSAVASAPLKTAASRARVPLPRVTMASSITGANPESAVSMIMPTPPAMGLPGIRRRPVRVQQRPVISGQSFANKEHRNVPANCSGGSSYQSNSDGGSNYTLGSSSKTTSGGESSSRSDPNTQHQVNRSLYSPTPPTSGQSSTSSAHRRKYRRQRELKKTEESSAPQSQSLSLPPIPLPQKQQIYKIDDESRARFGYMPQSSHQVNSTTTSAGVTKLPPINTPQRRGPMPKERNVNVTEHMPPLKPVNKSRRASRCPVKQEKSRLCLPTMTHCLTSQPQNISAPLSIHELALLRKREKGEQLKRTHYKLN